MKDIYREHRILTNKLQYAIEEAISAVCDDVEGDVEWSIINAALAKVLSNNLQYEIKQSVDEKTK